MNIHSCLRLFAIISMTIPFSATIPTQAENSRSAGQQLFIADGKSEATGMTNANLDTLIRRIDKNAKGKPGYWELKVEDRMLMVVTDENANRMRIMTPVINNDEINGKNLYRMMQANFDTSLDARYAIAKETVWSVFIHPLRSLGTDEFLSGVGQVVNLAESYGTSYSSGLLVFRGGDSGDLQRQREIIDRLLQHNISM